MIWSKLLSFLITKYSKLGLNLIFQGWHIQLSKEILPGQEDAVWSWNNSRPDDVTADLVSLHISKNEVVSNNYEFSTLLLFPVFDAQCFLGCFVISVPHKYLRSPWTISMVEWSSLATHWNMHIFLQSPQAIYFSFAYLTLTEPKRGLEPASGS